MTPTVTQPFSISLISWTLNPSLYSFSQTSYLSTFFFFSLNTSYDTLVEPFHHSKAPLLVPLTGLLPFRTRLGSHSRVHGTSLLRPSSSSLGPLPWCAYFRPPPLTPNKRLETTGNTGLVSSLLSGAQEMVPITRPLRVCVSLRFVSSPCPFTDDTKHFDVTHKTYNLSIVYVLSHISSMVKINFFLDSFCLPSSRTSKSLINTPFSDFV